MVGFQDLVSCLSETLFFFHQHFSHLIPLSPQSPDDCHCVLCFCKANYLIPHSSKIIQYLWFHAWPFHLARWPLSSSMLSLTTACPFKGWIVLYCLLYVTYFLQDCVCLWSLLISCLLIFCIYCVCTHMVICYWIYMEVKGQSKNQFIPSTMLVPEIELRSLGLVASFFRCSAIFLVQFPILAIVNSAKINRQMQTIFVILVSFHIYAYMYTYTHLCRSISLNGSYFNFWGTFIMLLVITLLTYKSINSVYTLFIATTSPEVLIFW